MGIERHHTDKLGNLFTVRPADFRQNIAVRSAVVSLFNPLWADAEDEEFYLHSVAELDRQEGLGAFQERQPQLIGASFVDFHPRDEWLCDFEDTEGVARLVNFAVHPDYHRRKVGAVLLADTVDFARERGAHVLRFMANDDASTAFYLGQQAELIHSIPGDEYLQINLAART